MSSENQPIANPFAGWFTTGNFGIFVICAGIYAAGSLGLPETSVVSFADQFGITLGSEASSEIIHNLFIIMPGVLLVPFIALFGFPAVIGITLGHFVISTTSLVGSIDLYSPIFTFIGLALVRYGGITGIILKKPNLLSGIVAYLIVTSIWMSYIAISLTDVTFNSIFFVAILSKIIPISIGLVIYLIINQLGIFSKTSS
ncbi:MAG: hypothetical protein VX368_02775 [Thermoproteota archaeon]